MKFPALENKIYLDTARSGLMFSELLSWRNKHEIDFLNRGSQFRLNHESLLDQTKLEINKFLGSTSLQTSESASILGSFVVELRKLCHCFR